MKHYKTEGRITKNSPYLKVFLRNQDIIEPISRLISGLESVRTCNVTHSDSKYHKGETLTVYPSYFCDIEDTEKEVCAALDAYYANTTILPDQIITDATFAGIEAKVISQIGKATTTINVCMAWFTNDKIRQALSERRKNGVEVRIIIYKDGVNKLHGVDLSEFDHKEVRGVNGGIMHNKFCIIDNHILMTGSYNWSTNAEKRNSENVCIIQDWEMANKYTKEFLKIWYAN